MTTLNLADEIQRLQLLPAEQVRREAMATVHEFREGLTKGNYRAAEKIDDRWQTNIWVKRAILLLFKTGLVESKTNPDDFTFFDKDTLPVKTMTLRRCLKKHYAELDWLSASSEPVTRGPAT